MAPIPRSSQAVIALVFLCTLLTPLLKSRGIVTDGTLVDDVAASRRGDKTECGEADSVDAIIPNPPARTAAPGVLGVLLSHLQKLPLYAQAIAWVLLLWIALEALRILCVLRARLANPGRPETVVCVCGEQVELARLRGHQQDSCLGMQPPHAAALPTRTATPGVRARRRRSLSAATARRTTCACGRELAAGELRMHQRSCPAVMR